MFGHVAGVESTFDMNGGIYVCHMYIYKRYLPRIHLFRQNILVKSLFQQTLVRRTWLDMCGAERSWVDVKTLKLNTNEFLTEYCLPKSKPCVGCAGREEQPL